MALGYVPGFLATVYDATLDSFQRKAGEGSSPYSEDHWLAYTLPHNALTFDGLPALRRAMRDSGSHYFDRDTIRFWNARQHGNLSSGRFWVESIKPDEGARRYRVCWVSRYSDHLSVEHTESVDSLTNARQMRTRIARAVEHAESAQREGVE